MTDPLDRPVWASLETAQRAFSIGDARARRYARDVNLFAAARDNQPDALEALGALIAPGDTVYILQRPEIALPDGVSAAKRAHGVQMTATQPVDPRDGADAILRLGDRDAAEMLALATLTEPGPFLARTHEMGRFWGVRRDGRLAAMAGERMRFDGHTELSGVCTHPDFRGLGLARRLSAHVTAQIQARGETAFLHAWATNTPAIRLYEALGFTRRCEMRVAVIERDRAGAMPQ